MKIGFYSVFLSTLLMIISCGGGGSTSQNKPNSEPGSNNDNTGSNTPNISDDKLNPAFEGKFFYHGGNGPVYFFNIETGVSEPILQTQWTRNSADLFPDSTTDVVAEPVRSGEYWILAAERCSFDLLSGGCLYRQDKFGNYFGKFLRFDNAEAESSLPSPDGKYVVVVHNTLTGDNPWAQIYDFDGKSYARMNLDKTSYDWLPDYRLVYVDGVNAKREFQFTKPLSFEVEYLLQLPEQVTGSGIIASFSLSPDGKYIAFKLKGENEDVKSSLWVMEIATGALNRLGQVGRGIDTLSWPRWSPSGAYIAVLSGGGRGTIFPDSSNPDPDALPPLDSLFIIPTENMMSETYIISRFDDKSEEVTELRQILPSSGITTREFPGFGAFEWVE